MSFWSRLKSQNGLNEISIDKDKSALYLTSSNVDADNGVKMVFGYSLPAPVASGDASGDADRQEDLIFSYWEAALQPIDPTAEEPEYNDHQDVYVHFYHALSQIRFCFSDNDDSFPNDVQIKSIAIGDVASGGTCTFWGKIAMDEYMRFDKKPSDNGRKVGEIFTWNNLQENETYRQHYGVTVNTSVSSYAGWKKGSYKKESTDYNLYTCQNVFMMIPQTLGDKACVRLTIVDSNRPEGQQEQEFISYLKPQGEKWEAGKYYTYKLNYKANQISFSAVLVGWGTVSGDREYTI